MQIDLGNEEALHYSSGVGRAAASYASHLAPFLEVMVSDLVRDVPPLQHSYNDRNGIRVGIIDVTGK